jgi:hypothetical protein
MADDGLLPVDPPVLPTSVEEPEWHIMYPIIEKPSEPDVVQPHPDAESIGEL